MGAVSGNPDLPNEQTDRLAGWLAGLLPGVQLHAGLAEQLHELLLLGGWSEPTVAPLPEDQSMVICGYCMGEASVRSHPTPGGGAIRAIDTHIDAQHPYSICQGMRTLPEPEVRG